jgi:SAM-dependent methyltransferase
VSDEPSVFANGAYVEARQARLRNLFAHIDRAKLSKKRVLELGAGSGELGQAFEELGCTVVSVEARSEHLVKLRAQYPWREAYAADLEQWDFSCLGYFDAILCFGLLYHLATPAEFLARCARTTNTIYLESIVTDAVEPVVPICEEEDGALRGSDQAFSGRGCRPSPAWIANELTRHGFWVRDISTGLANWGGDYPSSYDWQPECHGEWRRQNTNLRKMLICTRSAIT